MTLLAVLTWGAVAVLVLGSLAVFAWFLVDARTLLDPRGDGAPSDVGDPPTP